MDKNAIKKYAVWARRELISRVSQKALQYGVSEKDMIDAAADTINGHLLTSTEKKQRQALISRIKQIGYQQTMEEAAYTWFNRFSALRFMEVNGYLPTHIRVFTDEQNAFKPQILAEAIHLELDGLNMEKVYDLKDQNKTDELYKYLLITQCNALSAILSGMFTRIEDYTELLFPDNLLREGSVIEQMISMIPEDDWKDAVQIIGWLYQYYNAEPKDKVFADLKKNIKISKENIPAATQLFTPDWIVRYMVENSLGRLWVEGHPNDELKANWKYYLEEADQEPDVQTQLVEIHKEYAALKPEEIKVIDPCMGSGHILVYMFDVLVQIYEAYGYNAREAAGLILQNNLYGLDIDDRAAQLAYFAVMMKARQYDRRIFSRGIQPHVYAIVESNGVSNEVLDYFENGDADLKKAMEIIVDELHDAKEYGSILNVTQVDFAALYARLDEIKEDISLFAIEAQIELRPLIEVAEAMAQKYHTVVTNPPYMGSKGGMNATLKKYIAKNYERSKSDLYAVFMDVAYSMCRSDGYISMINQHGWMFLSSFSKLRHFIINNSSIMSMIHLGTRAFEEISGEVVQTTAFILSKQHLDYIGKYVRLVEIGYSREKADRVLEIAADSTKNGLYLFPMRYFSILPDDLIGYWISPKIIDIFNKEKSLTDIAKPRQGLSTSDNDRFLRLWFETDVHNIGFGFTTREDAEKSCKRWFPYNKGGEYRKWYGNNNYVINWQYDGKELRAWADYLNTHGTSMGRLVSQEFYFKKGLTWSGVGATRFGVRCYPAGMLFDVGANGLFVDEKLYYYLAGFLNTKLANEMIKILNPTINTGSGTVGKLPLIIDEDAISEINQLVQECVDCAKAEWDSKETSWEFGTHPMICGFDTIEESYKSWRNETEIRFATIKANEEKLNEKFISIYGLEGQVSCEVADEDVSVNILTSTEAVKSLVSYAVGCMFGRYSLNHEGLCFAGGCWVYPDNEKFKVDQDNIIPICDDEYFEDDLVGRFVEFIRIVYGENHLEQNLHYIANALNGNGVARDVIRNYFINEFYNDHCNLYSITGSGKRPIYWLFDSGKKNGFKALIYMHRYQPDTIARMRTDYVHEQQNRYRTAISDLEQRVGFASTGERVKLSKQLQKLQDQANEIRTYEEKIHHLADMMIPIDLDDGVMVNYAKFEDVLAKIK